MKNQWRLGNRLRAGLTLAAAVMPLGMGNAVDAATRSWIINSGFWDTPSNWAPSGLPLAGDNVQIFETDAVNRMVTLITNTPALQSLQIDNLGTGTNTLSLDGSFILTTTVSLTIGASGNGVFNQSGGTNLVGGFLGLGLLSSGHGTYNLSGGTLNVGDTLEVGQDGQGAFNQSGGSATINGFLNITLATYSMSNGASLTTNGEMFIGEFGSGKFTQTGGAFQSNAKVHVGWGFTGAGNAQITGGTWTAAAPILVADGGIASGAITLSGGTIFANDMSADSLDFGAQTGSTGVCILSGTGKLQVAGGEKIGVLGTAQFNQSAGTHTVAGAMTMGFSNSGSGTANFSGGVWTVNGLAAIGWDGAGSVSQTGGAFTANSGITVAAHAGSTGSYTLSSGSVTAPTLDIGAGGVGVVTGSGGSLQVPTINIYRNGTLNMAGSSLGGTVINNSGLLNVTSDIGVNGLTQGLTGLAQVDAKLTVNGVLTNDLGAPIGGTGQVNISGPFYGWGVVTPSVFAAGDVTARNGTLLLTGPSFSALATLQNDYGATLIVRSPSVVIGGNLVVNGGGGMVFSSPITVDVGKKLTMNGGVLATGGLGNSSTGVISGFGQIAGPITNFGSININGPSQFVGGLTNVAVGKLTVKNSQLVISGLTTNDGSIRVQTGGSIVFDEGLTGNPVAGSVPHGAASLDASSELIAPFIRQTSLTVGGTPGDLNSSAVAMIRPKGEGGATSLLGSLTFQTDGGGALLGRFDLADNALIVNYTGASVMGDIRKAIRSAYNASSAAHWTGAGLTSSIAGKTPGTALGYAEAGDVLGISGAQTADFQGQTADATSILVRYTLAGDSNLDGLVGFADLVAVAQHYGLSSGGATWFQGDFNYDGNVGFADLVALAQHYGSSLPAAATADGSQAFASVPEPSLLGMLIPVVLGLGRRRGRVTYPSA